MFPEQQHIYDTIVNSSAAVGTIAIYGAAGTGKSFSLKALYNAFLVSDITSIILAPTGVGGITLHDSINLIRLERYLKIHQIILLIDEVSMISRDLINQIDLAFRQILHSPVVFGGVQLIFFGDVAQLPPFTAYHEGYYFQANAFSVTSQFCLRVSRRQNIA